MNTDWYRKQLKRGRLLIRGTIDRTHPLEICRLRFLFAVDVGQGSQLVAADYRYTTGLKMGTAPTSRASAEADGLKIEEFLDSGSHTFIVISDRKTKKPIDPRDPDLMVHYGYVLAATRLWSDRSLVRIGSMQEAQALKVKLEGTVKHLPRK